MQEAAKPAVVPQAKGQRPSLPGVYFDSDMGRNIDTVLALAVLYGSSAKVKLIGNSVSNSSLEAAAFCDAMGRFYAGPVSSAPFSPSYYNPIGMPEDGAKPQGVSMFSKALAMKNAEGKPVFVHNVREIVDTADVRICLRNSLLTQKDGEGVVVMAGPASNLVRAMAFPGNRETVAAKVGVLVAAVGVYPAGAADPRVKADVAAARRLFAEWPGAIVAVGVEVGAALPFPGASIGTEFAWAPNHPVVETYKAYRALPYDAPSQAVAAALYAANRGEDYFQLSEPGTIQVMDDGRTRFEKTAGGKHRYLIVAADRREKILQAYVAAASAKPVVPAPRFRQQQQQAIPVTEKVAQ